MKARKQRIGCVIPCYKGGHKTIEVINKSLNVVDFIVLVDDKCPLQTGKLIYKTIGTNPNLKILFNKHNRGVGYSTKKGMRYLIEHGYDIVVKVDADGQINPELIGELVIPIVDGKSEASKGNRFYSVDHVISMPPLRLAGNLGLSFLSKISTGYWELFDPTNGFIAFKSSALKRVRLEKTDNRYFFESDLLFQSSLAQITFAQIPMISIYGDEVSSLRPMREISRFAGKHLINFLKRLVYQYFVLDFNAGSLELLGGSLGLLLTAILSVKILISGIFHGTYASSGESSLFAVLSIITVQMFIAFLYYDATQQPLIRQLRSKL